MEICKLMRQACFFTLIFLWFSWTIFSFEISNEEKGDGIHVLSSQEVVNEDFFIYGKTVEIFGTVNGDLYVLGGRVFIDGTIHGDLLVAGGSVEISGTVSQDVRVLGGQAIITGHVGRNVTAIGATFELSSAGTVGNNIVALGGNIDLGGMIGNNARIYTSSLRFSSHVENKIYAYVSQMRVTSKAYVGKTFEYWSDQLAIIDANAEIKGGVIHHPSFFYSVIHSKVLKGFKIGSKLAGFIMNFFYTLVIAFILMHYFKARFESALFVLKKYPFQSFLTGIVIVILLPLLCFAFLITVVGIPFALTLLAINIISFYSAKVLTITWTAKQIFSRFDFQKHRILFFICTLIMYYVVTLIPYLGVLIALTYLFFGLGGMFLSQRKDFKREPSN